MGSGAEQKSAEILSPALSHPSPGCGCHRTRVLALALSRDVSQLCHHVPGGMESCHSPTLRVGVGRRRAWGAGDERGAQGTGAGDGRDVGRGGAAAGGPKGRGGAGGTAWACPFKRRCLLSGFGTQPLSCLRLQRRRIKGLFHLNETLSPTSRGAASPTASSSSSSSPSLPGVLGSCPCLCPEAPGDVPAPGVPVLGTAGDSVVPEGAGSGASPTPSPCPHALGTGLNCHG